MKKILFVTWDGPDTNYLEALFIPVFKGIQDSGGYGFHVVQFSWADSKEVHRIRQVAQANDIGYDHFPVHRKPVASVGATWAVMRGAAFVKKIVKRQDIDMLMPRSNMPAWMINKNLSWYKKQGIGIIFDADGLPLEERADFAGLSKESLQYRWLKKQEANMVRQTEKVITRSLKSVGIHAEALGIPVAKFAVVSNGRDLDVFKFGNEGRSQVRAALNLQDNDTLFIYVGSLGPQYAWEEMLAVFQSYHQKHPNAFFLLLTRQGGYLTGRIPEELKNRIFVREADFSQIPSYMSGADIAFSLRQPTFSTQGVFPIKLGEYLLTGLPTLASKGIGDTEELLEGVSLGKLYDHGDPDRISKAVSWIESLGEVDREDRPEILVKRFGLEETVRRYGEVLRAL